MFDDFLSDHVAELVVVAGASGLLDDDVQCATCGRPLGDDPEGEPDPDAGWPICSECNRARDFDAIGQVEWEEEEDDDDVEEE